MMPYEIACSVNHCRIYTLIAILSGEEANIHYASLPYLFVIHVYILERN